MVSYTIVSKIEKYDGNFYEIKWQIFSFSDSNSFMTIGPDLLQQVIVFSHTQRHGFTSNLCGCSLGGHLPVLSLLKSLGYPYFSWNYG